MKYYLKFYTNNKLVHDEQYENFSRIPQRLLQKAYNSNHAAFTNLITNDLIGKGLNKKSMTVHIDYPTRIRVFDSRRRKVERWITKFKIIKMDHLNYSIPYMHSTSLKHYKRT